MAITPPRLPNPVAVGATAAANPGDSSGDDTYAVVPGDHLWLIAEARVTTTSQGDATEPMIAAYWRRLIDVNRDSLRSGDPNLIYPGEILTLPRLEAQP